MRYIPYSLFCLIFGAICLTFLNGKALIVVSAWGFAGLLYLSGKLVNR